MEDQLTLSLSPRQGCSYSFVVPSEEEMVRRGGSGDMCEIHVRNLAPEAGLKKVRSRLNLAQYCSL